MCVGWLDGRTCVEGLRVALSVKWEFGAGKSGVAGVFLFNFSALGWAGGNKGAGTSSQPWCPGRPVAAVGNGSNFPASFKCPIAFVFCTPALSRDPSVNQDGPGQGTTGRWQARKDWVVN